MTLVDGHCHIERDILQRPSLLAQRIEQMDRLGIEAAVIVAWNQAIAVDNREGNETVTTLAKRHPGRFIPFCSVNPWYGNRALEEIDRAVGDGARGLKLRPSWQGFQLVDPILRPVLDHAVSRSLPIYIPTGTPVAAMPYQLTFLAQEYATGVFIQGHFGSTDFWMDAIPSVKNAPNVYVDTASILPSFLDEAIAAVGAERVVFSSDHPYLSLENEVAKLMDLDVTDDQRSLIGRGNILRILDRSPQP